MKGLFKKALRWVKTIDAQNNFQPKWYAIFFKPQFITRHSVFTNIFKFSKNIHGKRILDVGCGEAPYHNLFEGCDYTGIDIEGGGHDDSLKKIDKFYNGADIPFDDQKFDLVLFTGVI